MEWNIVMKKAQKCKETKQWKLKRCIIDSIFNSEVKNKLT